MRERESLGESVRSEKHGRRNGGALFLQEYCFCLPSLTGNDDWRKENGSSEWFGLGCIELRELVHPILEFAQRELMPRGSRLRSAMRSLALALLVAGDIDNVYPVEYVTNPVARHVASRGCTQSTPGAWEVRIGWRGAPRA